MPYIERNVAGKIKSISERPQEGSSELLDDDNSEVLAFLDPPLSYAQKRLAEYPSFGDLFDALSKKEAGNSTEWDDLMIARDVVKKKYPKE
jgi:hypothetical protein|tara:strand:+ start:195 stop:467 length:273 start_codon:yes stop_codon:yes gene_type:complete